MSFTRVNPTGWAVGDTLTSSQMNALDVDHANALDKTSAGDTISGPILLGTGGSITTSAANQIVTNAARSIVVATNQGLVATVPGAIQSTDPGAICLNGGATDWLEYGTGHSYAYNQSFWGALLTAVTGSGFSSPGQIDGRIVGDGAGAIAQMPIQRVYHGSTLTAVKLWVWVTGTHTSVPATFPKFGVFLSQSAGSGGALPPSTPMAMLSTGGGFASFSAGSASAWNNGGQVQSLTLTPDQNNVIDVTSYTYWVQLNDETGTGALAGNTYTAFQFTFSDIGTSQPG